MASGMMLGMKSEQVRNVVHLLLMVSQDLSPRYIALRLKPPYANDQDATDSAR